MAITVVASLSFALVAAEDAAHRRQLVAEAFWHPQATTPQAARAGFVPTNTAAFRNYALDLMLRQANHINAKWRLGLPALLTSDPVTRLAVTPTTRGLTGGIVISNRYYFGFRDGTFAGYHDEPWWWQSLETNFPKLKELGGQRSPLSAREAAQVAEDALRQLGLAPAQFGLMETPVLEQRHYETADNQRLQLPLFLVRWVPAPDAQFGDIRIEVSGLTKQVVAYENLLAQPSPLPTNYFQMLGISPDSSKWGLQFGYNPRHTPAFEQFTREFATTQANRLIQSWQLDFPRLLTTNDIAWILAEPRTNAPSISAAFTNRFYLQMLEGYVGLFEDKAHSRSAFGEDDTKLRSPSVMTNVLDTNDAVRLAREALARLGLNEAKLRLRSPPVVTQLEIPAATGESSVRLPLYDVFWAFPPEEQAKLGEMSAVGVQVSAVTRRVVMFANNCPWTPKLALPTNYSGLIAVPHEVGPRRQRF
jgi:hypothetical protein